MRKLSNYHRSNYHFITYVEYVPEELICTELGEDEEGNFILMKAYNRDEYHIVEYYMLTDEEYKEYVKMGFENGRFGQEDYEAYTNWKEKD